MALSEKKRKKIERKERIEYVKSCSYSDRFFSPFSDAHWDAAAQKYIETGDESLKDDFPKPRSRNHI